MIGNLLKSEIEKKFERIKTTNPLYLHAVDGSLSAQQIHQYLANIHYLVRHTPIHLKRALSLSQQRRKTDLAGFFAAKIEEEVGHDAWAEDDMKNLTQRSEGRDLPTELLGPMRQLVEYIGQVIERDPLLYLTYILFSEYFTVIAAPEWLALLEKNCGIPVTAMSVVDNHSELDKEHTLEDIEAIDRLMDPVVDPHEAVEVLNRAFGFFENFAAKVGAIS